MHWVMRDALKTAIALRPTRYVNWHGRPCGPAHARRPAQEACAEAKAAESVARVALSRRPAAVGAGNTGRPKALPAPNPPAKPKRTTRRVKPSRHGRRPSARPARTPAGRAHKRPPQSPRALKPLWLRLVQTIHRRFARGQAAYAPLLRLRALLRMGAHAIGLVATFGCRRNRPTFVTSTIMRSLAGLRQIST